MILALARKTLFPAALVAAAFLYGAVGPGASPALALDETPASEAALNGARSLSIGQMRRLIVHKEPKPFVATQFKDEAGERLTLADFKGEIVLVNLWATWCAPCKKEMPSIDRLGERLNGQPFRIVAISVDRGDAIEKAKRFLSEEIEARHLDFYIDETFTLPREAGAVGLPTSFLIDRAGNEVARITGDAEWDSAEAVAVIERLLEN